ncbi:Helix-turn-helix domain-containing protein [Sporobacter termitidis DSM 10068]|uniref:Helix-turn-helix domain-containing protein n=1 Tax=Sporobacter termitidis DSM 10068 TaxID=1123282 RepID=A0A1M5YWT8_9FIRM|nr:helix-turn-helix transcriptional regulator [Sporobacter termitidis]SHI16318.1 Helix-turn-helix domain-containing protein [Sporobacter termitidis DSM 10068]
MYFPRLKDLRSDKDLLQKDIAKILDISQTVYSRYERGFQTIPVEHLITLADFYDTSTDYVLGRTNQTRPYKK